MNLSLEGFSCTLYKDDITAKEINRGAHLVPYIGDKGIMLDRFDCRGYMPDLRNYESHNTDPVLSHDEWEIEQTCDYERYYDLYHNNDSNDFKSKLDCDNESSNHSTQPRYHAVGYVYGGNITEQCVDSGDCNDAANDVEYICPPSLMLPHGMVPPNTEREAAIIEQTARFVTEKGAQLEILIKTKQANNSRFNFLNYDHKLHPFYRHITQLIKSAQYVPAKRHVSHLTLPQKELPDVVPVSTEPITPKVDINSTPYGKLIEKFKQSQERKRENKIEQVLQDVLQPNTEEENGQCNRVPSPESPGVIEARQKMYQELYHQYYPYYFQYCKETYGNLKPHDVLTELARDYAASSAAACIQSSMSETAFYNQKEDEEERIIRKMAEYVAKNGEELEQIMLERNKERFEFLLPDHANYNKYKRFLKEEIAILRPELEVSSEPTEQSIDCIIDSYGLHSPPHEATSGPISFKMTSKLKTSVPVIMKTTHSDDVDDDFDFADQLLIIAKTKHTSTPSLTNGSADHSKCRRVSRFSPANPKNIEIITAAFNSDLQTHRKRKAEQFLASLSVQNKKPN